MVATFELPMVVLFCALWRAWLQTIPRASWPGYTFTTRLNAIANCVMWLLAVNVYIASSLGTDKPLHAVEGGVIAAVTWIACRHIPLPSSSPYRAALFMGALVGMAIFTVGNS